MPSSSLNSPRASSARRRSGGNIPPRPSSSVGSPNDTSSSNAPPRIGGYTPQNLGIKRPIEFSSPTPPAATRPTDNVSPSRANQARTLGNFIGNQQADAHQGYDESEMGGGPSLEDANSQPSVLDAMYLQQNPKTSDDTENEDTDPTSKEAVRARNAAFQHNDRLGSERVNQFIAPQAASGEGTTSENQPTAQSTSQPGLNIRQVPADADYGRERAAARIQALQRQATPPLQDTNPAQQQSKDVNVQETATEAVEWLQRGRKVLLFFTGVGTITTLVEQNALVANRMLMNGAIQAPGLGGRPPGAYERNPNLRKIDRMDLFLALLLDSTIPIIVIGSIVSFLITILPYVLLAIGAAMAGQYFGEIGAELFTQLAN